MAICIHGDVCKAYMKRCGLISPLSNKCPNGCKYFKESNAISNAKSDPIELRMVFDHQKFAKDIRNLIDNGVL